MLAVVFCSKFKTSTVVFLILLFCRCVVSLGTTPAGGGVSYNAYIYCVYASDLHHACMGIGRVICTIMMMMQVIHP